VCNFELKYLIIYHTKSLPTLDIARGCEEKLDPVAEVEQAIYTATEEAWITYDADNNPSTAVLWSTPPSTL
jgi:hypothetical protein